MRQKGSGNTKVATSLKISTEAKLRGFTEKGESFLEITLPIVTVSEANGGRKKAIVRNGKKVYKSEHWREANSRHKKQKGLVGLMLNPHKAMFRLPCNVVLTRFAPRKLDHRDNLPMAMKWIVDAICASLTGDYRPGRADSDERITITYGQVQSSEYGVQIRLEFF